MRLRSVVLFYCSLSHSECLPVYELVYQGDDEVALHDFVPEPSH